jgi:hypothetical protein
MKTSNKLDKSFGPSGSSAGLFLFITGVVTTFTSFFGLILVVLGAFLGFTYTSAIIDYSSRRIRFSENLFGFVPTGKWIKLEKSMKIGIKESNMIWRTFSRSNRSLDTDVKDFRLILLDAEDQEIMPIMKLNSLDSAIAEQKILCDKLEISELN